MEKFSFLFILSCLSCCNNQNVPQKVNERSDYMIEEKVKIETSGVSSDYCNIEILIDFDQNFNNLTNDQVFSFWDTFDRTCELNVEYSQYSNELMFRFLSSYPELFLGSLEQISTDSKLEYIIRTLKYPVSDEYNTEILVSSLNSIEGYSYVRGRIIRALSDGQ
jgi:hypothetical protein